MCNNRPREIGSSKPAQGKRRPHCDTCKYCDLDLGTFGDIKQFDCKHPEVKTKIHCKPSETSCFRHKNKPTGTFAVSVVGHGQASSLAAYGGTLSNTPGVAEAMTASRATMRVDGPGLPQNINAMDIMIKPYMENTSPEEVEKHVNKMVNKFVQESNGGRGHDR